MQIVPLLMKKTQKTVTKDNITKYLYTCFDGGWTTLFRYAVNDDEAKQHFEEIINPDKRYSFEFIDPTFKQIIDEKLLLFKLKK